MHAQDLFAAATETRLSRRDLLMRSAKVTAGAAAIGLAMPNLHRAFAQDATPEAAFTGYQELVVTITDDAVTTSATEVSPGYLLLTIVNNSSQDATAGLFTLPGLTEEMMNEKASTPTPDDEIPPFLLEATIAGGPQDAAPNTTAQAVVKVTPGGWVVFPDSNQAPVYLTVKDEAEVGTEPASVASIGLTEFSFSGLDSGIIAGKQIWKVTNTGAEVHMLGLGKAPDGTTKDDVMTLLNSEMSGTPVAGGLQESDIEDVYGGVLLLSSGQTMWPLLDLEPGTYVAVCWVPDSRNGMPHVMEGMLDVFTVSA